MRSSVGSKNRFVCVCVTPSLEIRYSRTVHWIPVIFGTRIAHAPQMYPSCFGDDVMHINEWEGLNVKILKCSYFNNRSSILFHVWYDNVVR